MLGIMAVMDQKDFYTLVVGPGSGMCKDGFAGLRVDAPRAVASIGSQALNAPHYGRYGPEGQLPEAYRCVSVFSTLLGSTADTCDASACEDFWKNFSLFPPVRWIRFLRSAMSCGGDSFSRMVPTFLIGSA